MSDNRSFGPLKRQVAIALAALFLPSANKVTER